MAREGARARRPRPVVAERPPLDRGLHFGVTAPYDPQPDLDLKERIETHLKRILAEHRPPPLPAEVLAQMRAAQASFRARHVT